MRNKIALILIIPAVFIIFLTVIGTILVTLITAPLIIKIMIILLLLGAVGMYLYEP